MQIHALSIIQRFCSKFSELMKKNYLTSESSIMDNASSTMVWHHSTLLKISGTN